MKEEILIRNFPSLSKTSELRKELSSFCSIQNFKAGTVLLKEGGYIKVIPLVISGLLKVFKEEENGNEVLLYYIEPGESCFISVINSFKNETSKVKAIVEQDAEIILLPADKVTLIAKKFHTWNEFVYDLFNHKYDELIHVITTLTFSKKDARLMEYLEKESELKGSKKIKVTHQQIGIELGSSREVISRLLKKLENEEKIQLGQGFITLLS